MESHWHISHSNLFATQSEETQAIISIHPSIDHFSANMEENVSEFPPPIRRRSHFISNNANVIVYMQMCSRLHPPRTLNSPSPAHSSRSFFNFTRMRMWTENWICISLGDCLLEWVSSTHKHPSIYLLCAYSRQAACHIQQIQSTQLVRASFFSPWLSEKSFECRSMMFSALSFIIISCYLQN